MTKQFQSGKFQHFFPGKRISHPIPLPPMELFTLSLDSSFSVCFFSLFFLLFRERRELLPGKPTQNSHFGILAWSCSCAVGGHRLRRGGSLGIWEAKEQSRPAGTILLCFPGKRDGSQASSLCPGLSGSQDFSWMCFLVWLRSFSPSLPSLALFPAPKGGWNKGSLCCFLWKIGKTTRGEIPLLQGLGARYPSHPSGIRSLAGV